MDTLTGFPAMGVGTALRHGLWLALGWGLCSTAVFGNNGPSFVSSSGKYVAFQCRGESRKNKDGTTRDIAHVAVWDLAEALEVQRLVETGRVKSIDFSPDDRFVLVTSDRGLSVWTLDTGERLQGFSGLAGNAVISPQGRLAVSVIGAGRNQAWDRDRKSLKLFTFPELRVKSEHAAYHSPDLASVRFSSDGSRFYASRKLSNDEYKRIYGNSNRPSSMLSEWDATSGQVLGDFRWRNGAGLGAGDISVNREFLAQVLRNELIVWDLATRREVRRFNHPDPNVDSWSNFHFSGPAFFCDARDSLLASVRVGVGSADRIVEFDLRTGELLVEQPLPANWTGYDSGISIHPSGRFFCVASEALRGKLAVCRLKESNKQSGVEFAQPAAVFRSFENHRESMAVLADGKTCRYGASLESAVPELTGAARRELGKNHDVEAVTAAMREALQPRAARPLIRRDLKKPRLWVLAVGVGNHKYADYDTLAYCVDDVTDVTQRLQAERGRVFGDVQSQLLTNEQATPERILLGLQWIVRCSQEDDYVLIYFAGHAAKAHKGLYFLPFDGDMKNLAATSLNWADVGRQLVAMPVKQVFFMTDCCHAGAFAKEMLPQQAEIAKALEGAKNLTILAASEGDAESFEVADLGHGAFTFAFLEALDGRADANGDRQINWKEATDFVVNRVPELTDGKQRPKLQTKSPTADSVIIAIAKEDKPAGNQTQIAPEVGTHGRQP